jgi:hypothetical protein
MEQFIKSIEVGLNMAKMENKKEYSSIETSNIILEHIIKDISLLEINSEYGIDQKTFDQMLHQFSEHLKWITVVKGLKKVISDLREKNSEILNENTALKAKFLNVKKELDRA